MKKNLKRNISEKMKLIILVILTSICIAFALVLCVKLPDTGSFNGDSISKEMESIVVENDVVYEQKFKPNVNSFEQVSVLMFNETEEKTKGTIKLETLYEGKVLGTNTYEIDMIPNINYLGNYIGAQRESFDKEYTLRISATGMDKVGSLKFAIKKADVSALVKNGEPEKIKVLLNSSGKKDDVTYFWYPIMALFMLIPFYAMIDYKKVRKATKND